MRNLAILLFLSVGFPLLLRAQTVPVLRLSGLPPDSSITDKVLYRVTEASRSVADTLDAATYRKYPSSSDDSPESGEATLWLRFDLLNDSSAAVRRLFSVSYYNDVVTLYYAKAPYGAWSSERIGSMVPYRETEFRYSNLIAPFDFAPGERVSFLVKITSDYYGRPSPALWLGTPGTLRNDFWSYYANGYDGTYISVLILGAVLAIFLFVAFLYITTRDPLYLYYGLYLGGVALYFSAKTDSLFFLGYWVQSFPQLIRVLNEPIQMLYTALYIRFSMGLLRIGHYDRPLHRFLSVVWKGLAAYSVVIAVVSSIVWSHSFDRILLAVDRGILLTFTLVMLVRIIQKNRSPLLGYFLAGNAFFLSGVVVSTVTSLGLVDSGLLGTLEPINYFQIGVTGEIMCFSFALGYNVRVLERERNNHQQAYIDQLRLNQQLTDRANRELSEKLAERTREVLAMSEAMQEQKEAHLRSEFEFQLGEMEMQALRAQMNPHFIFNSLNTIRYFVLNNENEKASDYLGKFARLLRMVLQNSRENTIPLSEELEALRLYLEIEAKRFGDSFAYSIVVSDDMDTDAIIVPPLLLQPFAENAIWHGLLHSDKPDKQITVRISEQEDTCHFTIEDNGVGRARAHEMKSRSANVKKSFGMQITNKRVELFNKNFASQIEINVRDLVDSTNEPAGTAVEISYLLPQ